MIFVTGDTHRFYLSHIIEFCDKHPELTKDDYIIIAGDFGAVWSSATLERDLKPYSDLPVTILFVDGNHENFQLLNSYPVEMWKGGKVHKIKPDIIHLMRGQVYELQGKTIFTFGGAKSTDRYKRVENESWWQAEEPTFDELDEGVMNLKRYNNKVDYIITHSCGVRATMYPKLRNSADIKLSGNEIQLLSNFEDIVEFKHWYFGHFHLDERLSDKYTVLLHEVVEL